MRFSSLVVVFYLCYLCSRRVLPFLDGVRSASFIVNVGSAPRLVGFAFKIRLLIMATLHLRIHGSWGLDRDWSFIYIWLSLSFYIVNQFHFRIILYARAFSVVGICKQGVTRLAIKIASSNQAITSFPIWVVGTPNETPWNSG